MREKVMRCTSTVLCIRCLQITSIPTFFFYLEARVLEVARPPNQPTLASPGAHKHTLGGDTSGSWAAEGGASTFGLLKDLHLHSLYKVKKKKKKNLGSNPSLSSR